MGEIERTELAGANSPWRILAAKPGGRFAHRLPGGLHPDGYAHRTCGLAEVGRILLDSECRRRTPCGRAVIGSGSTSFEMRHLTDVLASLPCPQPRGCATSSSRSRSGTCSTTWSPELPDDVNRN
jgi:hypothetical protein